MTKQLSKLHIYTQLWLVILAIVVFTLGGCDTEKRITKALMEQDSKGQQTLRAWPYNYTYHNYSNKLDNAKLKQLFYKNRAEQAKDIGDTSAAKINSDNEKRYQEIITRLENDREFYKIYKLYTKKLEAKLKKEAHEVKEIEKQKEKKEKITEKRLNVILKKHDEQQKIQDEKVEEQQEKIAEIKKTISKKNEAKLKEKEKELKQFQKELKKASEDDKGYYEDEIKLTQEEIAKIKRSQERVTKTDKASEENPE